MAKKQQPLDMRCVLYIQYRKFCQVDKVKAKIQKL